MATEDDFDDIFGDNDREAEPAQRINGILFAPVLCVGPRCGLHEFEARYSGVVPICPVTFVSIDDDTGEAHEEAADPVQIAICEADAARRVPLIEAARLRDLAEGSKS